MAIPPGMIGPTAPTLSFSMCCSPSTWLEARSNKNFPKDQSESGFADFTGFTDFTDLNLLKKTFLCVEHQFDWFINRKYF